MSTYGDNNPRKDPFEIVLPIVEKPTFEYLDKHDFIRLNIFGISHPGITTFIKNFLTDYGNKFNAIFVFSAREDAIEQYKSHIKKKYIFNINNIKKSIIKSLCEYDDTYCPIVNVFNHIVQTSININNYLAETTSTEAKHTTLLIFENGFFGHLEEKEFKHSAFDIICKMPRSYYISSINVMHNHYDVPYKLRNNYVKPTHLLIAEKFLKTNCERLIEYVSETFKILKEEIITALQYSRYSMFFVNMEYKNTMIIDYKNTMIIDYNEGSEKIILELKHHKKK